MPVMDEMITTEPPPAARRWLSPDRISSAACPALSSKVAVKSPGAESVRLPPMVPPAFATSRSRPPSSAAMSATARSSDGVSVTSAVRGADRHAVPGQAAGRRGEAVRAAGDQADGGALGGQRLGHGIPDAAAASGDQRAGAAQVQVHAEHRTGRRPRASRGPWRRPDLSRAPAERQLAGQGGRAEDPVAGVADERGGKPEVDLGGRGQPWRSPRPGARARRRPGCRAAG